MEFLQQLLLGGVGAGVVAGIFKLAEWALNRKAKLTDAARQQRSSACDARGRELQDLKKMVEGCLIADRVILYEWIKYLAKSYIDRGWIYVEEYEDLVRMHKVYHDELSGNGFLDELMKTVSKLEKRVSNLLLEG